MRPPWRQKARRFTDNQIISFLRFLLVAGSATTILLIGNVLHRLLENSDALAAVVADPGRIPTVIEESLRVDAPVLGLFRANTCPVSLHGNDIPDNSKVLISFAAANRDEQVFERADEFDIDRSSDELPTCRVRLRQPLLPGCPSGTARS